MNCQWVDRYEPVCKHQEKVLVKFSYSTRLQDHLTDKTYALGFQVKAYMTFAKYHFLFSSFIHVVTHENIKPFFHEQQLHNTCFSLPHISVTLK